VRVRIHAGIAALDDTDHVQYGQCVLMQAESLLQPSTGAIARHRPAQSTTGADAQAREGAVAVLDIKRQHRVAHQAAAPQDAGELPASVYTLLARES